MAVKTASSEGSYKNRREKLDKNFRAQYLEADVPEVSLVRKDRK